MVGKANAGIEGAQEDDDHDAEVTLHRDFANHLVQVELPKGQSYCHDGRHVHELLRSAKCCQMWLVGRQIPPVFTGPYWEFLNVSRQFLPGVFNKILQLNDVIISAG